MLLLSVGDFSVDVYAHVPQLPSFGEKLAGEPLGSFGGGVGGNFGAAAARYGTPARVLAAVGADAFGQFALEQAQATGADTSHIAIREDEPTTWHFVAVDDRGDKALTLLPTALFFPRYEWFAPEAFADATHMHIAALDVPEALRFVHGAVAAGLTVSLDVEPAALRKYPREQVDDLITRCDVLSVNEYSLADLSGLDPAAGARWLKDHYQVQVVLVTLGEHGAIVVDASGSYRVAATPAERVVDTTGAGDCFNAVFVSEWSAGCDSATAGARASVAAGRSVGALGSRTAYPTKAEVLAVPSPNVEKIAP